MGRLKSQGAVMDLRVYIRAEISRAPNSAFHILEASKPSDVGHVFPASRVSPMHSACLPLRASRAFQEPCYLVLGLATAFGELTL